MTITATAHSSNGSDYRAGIFPRIYQCDDDIDRLIVFNSSGDGRTIFGELLASRLAQLIGAPVPVMSLVDVPAGVVSDLAGQPWDGSFDVAGVHVGFEREANVAAWGPGSPLQSEIANLSAIASAIALGGWLDTRPGMIYFTADRRMWFGWFRGAFGGDGGPRAWTAETLAEIPSMLPWGLLARRYSWHAPFDLGVGGYLSVPANVDAIFAAAETIAGVSSEAIHDAIYTDVPEEWSIPAEDLAAVESRLIAMQPILGAKLNGAIYRATHPTPPYDVWPAPYDV